MEHRDDRYSDERTEQTVANRKHKNQHELYWGLGAPAKILEKNRRNASWG